VLLSYPKTARQSVFHNLPTWVGRIETGRRSNNSHSDNIPYIQTLSDTDSLVFTSLGINKSSIGSRQVGSFLRTPPLLVPGHGARYLPFTARSVVASRSGITDAEREGRESSSSSSERSSPLAPPPPLAYRDVVF